jgi:tetratricopeptide (TPR) repeat protein
MRWAVIVVFVSWAAVAQAQGAHGAAPAASGSPTAGPWEQATGMLTRALRLYEQGAYASASIELQRVLSGVSGDTAENVKRAQLVLGAALHRMGYPAAALGMFDRIVQEGPTHPRHMEVVTWLLVVGEVPGIEVGPYLKLYRDELDAVAATLDEAGRAALLYQLGADRAVAGEAAEARALLERVAAGTKHYGRARLALARLTLARGELAAGEAAAIAKAGDPAAAADAARSIAESRYATGDRAGALAALEQLAAVAPAAVFARSRMELERAGVLPGLAETPVATFEAVTVATACAQGFTERLLPRAAATIRNAREALDELLAVSDDNAETYEAVDRYLREGAARGAGAPRPSEIVVRMALARIGTPVLWVDELTRELRRLQAADKAWQTTEVAAEVLQELTVQHAVATADLGKLFRDRLASVRRDLDGVARALGTGAVAIAAGPKVAPGRGLIVTEAMCAVALRRTGDGAQLAAPAGSGPAVRSHGCAGCAGAGEPPLVLALAWLVSAAARRARSRRRARGRRPDTAGAATPSRGP